MAQSLLTVLLGFFPPRFSLNSVSAACPDPVGVFSAASALSLLRSFGVRLALSSFEARLAAALAGAPRRQAIISPPATPRYVVIIFASLGFALAQHRKNRRLHKSHGNVHTNTMV